MIISASYKTDIPAFYSKWFQNRLRAGFCKMVNPYNNDVYDISLRKTDVQAFVFWSRNYQPFLELNLLDQLPSPFMCHMTITNYPRELDQATIKADKAIKQVQILSQQYGARSVVWRYDPIVVGSILSVDWHVENFERLAKELEGSVNEVVVSYVQLYQKTKRNFSQVGFECNELDTNKKQTLLLRLYSAALKYGITLTLCAQPDLLTGPIKPSACIDAQRLAEISGRDLYVKKIPHRKECGCVSSKDIGDYNTCPHGCLYCYAVEKRDLAKLRFQNHDPNSPFLFEPKTIVKVENEDQGQLF